MDRNTLNLINSNKINPNGPSGKISAEAHREVNKALADYAETVSKNPIKTIATINNGPTVYIPGGPDIFETYIVRDPLVLPNNWGYEVTEAELLLNDVYFDVINGNINKVLRPNRSAYQSYLNTTNDTPVLNEKEWIDRYDNQRINNILKSFLNSKNPIIPEILGLDEILTINGDRVPNGGSKVQLIDNIEGYDTLIFKGYVAQVGTVNFPNYSAIVAIKKDGTKEVILGIENADVTPSQISDIEINLPYNTVSVLISWNNNGPSFGVLPYVEILDSDSRTFGGEDALYNELKQRDSVIEYFLNSEYILRGGEMVPLVAVPLSLGVLNTSEGAGNNSQLNIDVRKYRKARINLYPTLVAFDAFDLYATVLGIQEDGNIVILEKPTANLTQAKIDKVYDLLGISYLSIGWSNYEIAATDTPLLELFKAEKLPPLKDAVKKYIDIAVTNSFTSNKIVNLPEENYEIRIDGELPVDISDNREPTEVIVSFLLGSKVVLSAKAILEIQGQASVGFPKKNYSINFLNSKNQKLEISFGEGIATDSFVLKSYYTDPSKISEQTAFNLWYNIRTSGKFPESRIDNAPLDFSLNSDNIIYQNEAAKFYPYGFNVTLTVKNEFYGIYCLRLKKTRENYKFNSKNKKHIFLDFDYKLPTNSIDPSTGYPSMLSFNDFKPGQWELRSPKITGYEAGANITDTAVNTAISNLWSWLSKIYNKNLIDILSWGPVANLEAWIDYYLICEIIYHTDGLDNNILIGSWDGAKFSPLIYDCDIVFGAGAVSVLTSPPYDQIFNNGTRGARFWRNFYFYYSTEIKLRYNSLRASGILDFPIIEDLINKKSRTVKYQLQNLDNTKWGYWDQSSYKLSPLQIKLFINERLDFLDGRFI